MPTFIFNSYLNKLSLNRLLAFVLLFSTFEFIYFQIPDDFLRSTLYQYGLVQPCASIIKLLIPGIHLSVVDNNLASGTFRLEIVRGCDGAGSIFILLAAIIVYKAPIKVKLAGLALGFLFMQILNLTRVVTLFLVMNSSRHLFAPIHSFFAPSLIIIMGCIFFAIWTDVVEKKYAT